MKKFNFIEAAKNLFKKIFSWVRDSLWEQDW